MAVNRVWLDDERRHLMRFRYKELVRNLNPDAIVDYLYQEEWLTLQDLRELVELACRADRSERLLEIISISTPRALEMFCEVLARSQLHLAGRLHPVRGGHEMMHVSWWKRSDTPTTIPAVDVYVDATQISAVEERVDRLQNLKLGPSGCKINVLCDSVTNGAHLPVSSRVHSRYVLVGGTDKLIHLRAFNLTARHLGNKAMDIIHSLSTILTIDFTVVKISDQLFPQRGACLVVRMPFLTVIDVLCGLSDDKSRDMLYHQFEETLSPATCVQLVVGNLPPLCLFGDTDEFLEACRIHNLPRVKSVLADGVDVNKVYRFGETALHVAVDRDEPELIGVLLEHNADVNVKDCMGCTPYERAERLECHFSLAALTDHDSKYWKTVAAVEQNFSQIVENLQPSLLTDHLYLSKYISKEDLLHLQSLEREEEKASSLIMNLLPKGRKWFDGLLLYMERTGRCPWALEMLRSGDNDQSTDKRGVTEKPVIAIQYCSVAFIADSDQQLMYKVNEEKLQTAMFDQFRIPTSHFRVYYDNEWKEANQLAAPTCVKMVSEDPKTVGLTMYGIPAEQMKDTAQEVFRLVGDCIGLKLWEQLTTEVNGNFVFTQMCLKELLTVISLFGDKHVREQLKCSLQTLLPYVEIMMLWVGGLPPLLMVGDSETLYTACRQRDLVAVSALLQAGVDPNDQAHFGRTPLHMAAVKDFDDIAAALIRHGADVDAKADCMFPALCTPLHMTAMYGSDKVAAVLLNNKCKVDETNKLGRTALHISSCFGDISVSQLLIEHHADIDCCGTEWHRTPFLEACRGGHVAIVRRLISAECDKTAKSKQNNGALGQAALKNHLAVVEFLVNVGFSVNEKQNSGDTSLHISCHRGHLALCEFLLQNGADIESIDDNHRTPLLMACSGGHVPILEFLIQAGCDKTARADDNNGALGLAASNGHLAAVKFLVEVGFNVNDKQCSGYTSLHISCHRGHLPLCEFLLQNGADIESIDDYHRTPLLIACIGGHVPILEFLIQAGCDKTATADNNYGALGLAAWNGHLAAVKFLVEGGFNVNDKQRFGDTSLHISCENGHLPLCEFLLQNGADIESIDDYQRTPLLMACIGGHVPILEFLLQAGCDKTARMDDNGGALGLAAWNGHLAAVKFLVGVGFNVNDKQRSGDTSLHISCLGGHLPLCEFLLQNGADIESIDDYHRTPLLMACIGGHVPILEFLIQAGCDKTARIDNNYGALGPAAWNGHLAAVKFLVEVGFNVNDKQRFGRTALHIACLRDHQSVAEFLITANADVNIKDESGSLPYTLARGKLREIVEFAGLYAMGTAQLKFIKICFIGSPMAGKTTLCNAIRRGLVTKVLWANENSEETNRQEERTLSMNVYEENISSVGDVVLCDFAGHQHFHGTHGIFFDKTNTIYAMLLNGRNDKDKILKNCVYWCSFLSACCLPYFKPVVVMVMSKADCCTHQQPYELMENIIDSTQYMFQSQLRIEKRFFIIDCRKSQSTHMKQLRTFFATIKNTMLQAVTKYPRLCVPVQKKLLPRLRQRSHSLFMPKTEFTELIQTELNVVAPRSVLDNVVQFLHRVGQVLCLKNAVVLSIPMLASLILGPLISPLFFHKYRDKSLGDGLIAKDKILLTLSDFRERQRLRMETDVDHAVEALQHLGVCFELDNCPGVYCFPCHLPDTTKRQTLWGEDLYNNRYVGRRLKCVRETDIFAPGLFAYLQCRSTVSIDRNAHIWKGGMKLLAKHEGHVVTECLVELSKMERAIDVVVRAPKGHEKQMLASISKVMTTLNDMLEEKSCGTKTEKYYLCRRDIKKRKKDPLAVKEEDVIKAKQDKTVVVFHSKNDYFAETIDDLIAYSDDEDNEATTPGHQAQADRVSSLSGEETAAELVREKDSAMSGGAQMAVPVEPCTHAFIQLSNEPKWDYDVFLCHEGGSKAFARKIFNALAYKRIRAFLDETCFLGAQDVCPTLARAIYMSRFVMVILTPQIIGKRHPTFEYHLARERHKIEQYSTTVGVILPVFYTISPDKLSQYLDIEIIGEIAGYEPKDELEDDFLWTKLIPKFTSLIKKVENDKEELIQGRLKLKELIEKAGLPLDWYPRGESPTQQYSSLSGEEEPAAEFVRETDRAISDAYVPLCDVCTFPDRRPTDLELLGVGKRIGPSWRTVARLLQPRPIPYYEQNDIASTEGVPSEHALLMLHKWLLEHGKAATVRRLCNALDQAEYRDVALTVFGDAIQCPPDLMPVANSISQEYDVKRQPNDKEVSDVCRAIAGDWQRVAYFLGPQPLAHYEIVNIEKRERNPEEQAVQMLVNWRNKHSTKATVKRLCQALINAGLKEVAIHTFGHLMVQMAEAEKGVEQLQDDSSS